MKTKNCAFCNKPTTDGIEFQKGFKIDVSCPQCWGGEDGKFAAKKEYKRIKPMNLKEASDAITAALSGVLNSDWQSRKKRR